MLRRAREDGNEVSVAKANVDEEGLLVHLENVGAMLAEPMKIADLTRMEFHGTAAELDKLRGPVTHLNPGFFALEFKME